MKKWRVSLWSAFLGTSSCLFLLIWYTIYHKAPVQLLLNEKSLPNKHSGHRKPEGKIMFMAASYDLGQYHSLWNSLSSLVEVCNAGWNVSVHLQVSNSISYDSVLFKQIQNSLYCAYFDKPIPVLLTFYDQSIGFGLNSRHRQLIQKHLSDFDYFIYAEEDMVFRYSHLVAYLQAYARIKQAFPHNYHSYTIGFLRYEESSVSNERVTWEYDEGKIHLVKLSSSTPSDTYIVTNNMNQAINIFSRQQIEYLQEVCDFLTQPGLNLYFRELRKALNKDWKFMSVGISEWSSSFQHVLQCGVYRVIPLRHYEQFFILHGTQKGHKRRKRATWLNSTAWARVLSDLQRAPINRTVEEVYRDEIYNKQYNLHLMQLAVLEGKIKYRRNV